MDLVKLARLALALKCHVLRDTPPGSAVLGSPITRYLAEVMGFSSLLSFTTRSAPARLSAMLASTGATWWHGPHHCAQNSAGTGSSDG